VGADCIGELLAAVKIAEGIRLPRMVVILKVPSKELPLKDLTDTAQCHKVEILRGFIPVGVLRMTRNRHFHALG
jgi:hypothetical protein